jgi:hypothetical protein
MGEPALFIVAGHGSWVGDNLNLYYHIWKIDVVGELLAVAPSITVPLGRKSTRLCAPYTQQESIQVLSTLLSVRATRRQSDIM